MVLNWNIEVIIDFLLAIVGIILSITSYISPKAKKITSLFFIRLGFISFWLFMLLDGLAFLFLSELLGIIDGLLLIPSAIFIIIGINYAIKEHFYSIALIIVLSLAVLFIYVAFLPGAVVLEFQSGYLRIRWIGLFNILGMTFSGISTYYLFYWGIKTWLNTPFLIKKEASLFFFGILLIFPLAFLFYILYIYERMLILVSDLAIVVGALIISITVMKEPKLLYILPFTIYRIVVKDRRGQPLYDHDWSESNISETIFTGFLNAVQLMSEEVIHMGGLLDIHLEDGILIVRESERITVGLVASKSSILLKDSVLNLLLILRKNLTIY
ncbi:MAG: hypothetical protein ACFE9Q_03490 [Candidatus Hodarchaeota archaeon]